MAIIMIENLCNKRIQVKDMTRTLLQHFQDHQIDWMQACGAKGRCLTCKVLIKGGREQFLPFTKEEQKYYQEGALKSTERLACQTKINGDVILISPKEYQLPHILYSDQE